MESARHPHLRILVASDASAHSLAAMQVAVDLAAVGQSELLGLFVEDANVLRYVELPTAWAVSRLTGDRVRLDLLALLGEMRAQAEAATAALASAVAGRPVRWHFRTVRGPWPGALFGAVAESGVDLLAVGRSEWRGRNRLLAGVLQRALVAQGTASTVIVSHGQRIGGPVAVVTAGTPLSAAAEHLGAGLADRMGVNSHIFTAPPTAASAGAATVGRLLAWLADSPAGLVVLPADWPALAEGGLGMALDELPCPVILAR